MKTLTLPTPFTDVMVTFKKGTDEITKRGFYSDSFNQFSVPPEYREFNGFLLPHGFGGDRLTEKDVIKWEYCND